MSDKLYYTDNIAFATFGGNNFYWYRPNPGKDGNLIFICDCGPYSKRFIYLQRSYYENGSLALVDKIAVFKVRRTNVPLKLRLLVRGM